VKINIHEACHHVIFSSLMLISHSSSIPCSQSIFLHDDDTEFEAMKNSRAVIVYILIFTLL